MSDSTNVGSIVAYLRMNRDQWRRDQRDTEDDARRLGRLNPDIRISTNAASAIAQLNGVRAASDRAGSGMNQAAGQAHLLRDAIVLLGPAAVPVAAVTAGAFLGLVPTLAAAALGVSGIKAEMKSGALASTQYGADINQLQDWLTQLKGTAASGLLKGVDVAVAQSSPLFATLNQDIGATSNQLGNIVAGAAPALLRILTQLNPLFLTLGNVISTGAQRLDAWAQSSDGVSHFVSYVQAELPAVIHLLSGLVVLFSHIVQGAAPLGGAVLAGVSALVDVLDAIPVDVLREVAPLAFSIYAAFRSYALISAIVRGVNAAVSAMTGPFVTSAAAAQASSLQIQAAEAEAAAATAVAQAEMATAAATAAEEIAAATAGTSSILAEGAAATAATAAAEAEAFQAAAASATAAAAEIGAAATAAAETSAAEGAVASAGWAASLGPIGAVVVGAGILGLTLANSGQDAQKAAQEQDSYTQALIASKGAIDGNVRSTVAKTLSEDGALTAAQRLNISQGELVRAVTEGGAAYDNVRAKLDGLSTGQDKTALSTAKIVEGFAGTDAGSKTTAAGIALLNDVLGTTRSRFASAASGAASQRTAAEDAATAIENLTNALNVLGQTELAQAQSEDAFKLGLIGVKDSVKQNGRALNENTKGGLQNRDMLVQLLGQAVTLANAQRKNGVGIDVVTKSLQGNVAALERTAIAAGLPRKAVEALVRSMGLTPKQIGTKFNVDTRSAQRQAETIQDRINAIKQGKVPGIDADTTAARNEIFNLQAQLDGLHDKTVTVTVATRGQLQSTYNSQVPKAGRAMGGGAPEGWFAVGEQGAELVHKSGSSVQIYSHGDSRAIIAATGMRAPGFAGGTAKAPKVTSSEVHAFDSAAGSLIHAAADNSATAKDVRDAASSLKSAAASAHVSSSALAAVAGIQAQIGRDAAQRASVAARLGTAPSRPTAYEQLASAQDKLNNDRTAFGAGIAGSFDITSAGAGTSSGTVTHQSGATVTTVQPGGGPTVAGITADSDAAVRLAHQYESILKRLAAEGLDEGELLQLAGKGPSEGMPVALALSKATPAQIRHLAANNKSIAGASSSLGGALAHRFDDAGVNAAKGLISGLQSQEKALDHAMDRLAHRMIARLRAGLKIHSPSRLTHEIGGFVAQGLANGMTERIPHVSTAADRLAAAAVPAGFSSARGGFARNGRAPFDVHIHPTPGMSERAVGHAAGDEIAWALAR